MGVETGEPETRPTGNIATVLVLRSYFMKWNIKKEFPLLGMVYLPMSSRALLGQYK